MKKEWKVTILVILVEVLFAWICYTAPGTGRRNPLLLEEKGEIINVDLYKQQITVQLDGLNNYYDGLKLQPYDNNPIVLNCRWMEDSASVLKEIKNGDEVIYMHYDNKPDRVERLEVLYEEQAVVTGVFLYRNEIKVKLRPHKSIYDFYAKEEFFHKTPVFTLNTVNEKRKYEVFAAVETRVLYQNEEGFRYYEQLGELSEKEFVDLAGWLSENSLYDTGITPIYGEQILILSTCSYNTQNGRFIVAARLAE